MTFNALLSTQEHKYVSSWVRILRCIIPMFMKMLCKDGSFWSRVYCLFFQAKLKTTIISTPLMRADLTEHDKSNETFWYLTHESMFLFLLNWTSVNVLSVSKTSQIKHVETTNLTYASTPYIEVHFWEGLRKEKGQGRRRRRRGIS